MKKIVLFVLVLALLVGTGSAAFGSGQSEPAAAPAAGFPEKGHSIRMVITHGLGGSVDTAGRGIAPYLEKYLGVPVVPENMEGAGGRRAMEFTFAAPPDGYTIVVSAYPSRLLGELLYPESKFKMKEFTHLGSFSGGDYRTVIVAKDSPFKTIDDLKKAGESKKLKAAGGGGLGSTSQLQTVFLQQRVGLNVDFIPFDSGSEVANAVIGKHVDFGVLPLANALRYVQQGELRVLAIHAPTRSAYLPDAPTMEEMGYKRVVVSNGVGAWAPPGTPQAVVDKYDEAITKAMADPDYKAWAEKTNQMTVHMGPAEFLQDTLRDYDSYSDVIPLLKADAEKTK